MQERCEHPKKNCQKINVFVNHCFCVYRTVRRWHLGNRHRLLLCVLPIINSCTAITPIDCIFKLSLY